MKKVLILCLIPLLLSCDGNNSEEQKDNFDRSAMLVNWADNLIIPAYSTFYNSTQDLKNASDAFVQEVSQANLDALRAEWEKSYVYWQSVGLYQIGPAERLDMLGNMNTYPCNAETLESLLAGGSYDLTLPSRRNVQGFPALDYLLFGLGESDVEILAKYEDSNYRDYLTAVVSRINDLTQEVYNEWNDTYRDSFVSNSGSSATSSVNKLANDFIFFFEGRVRTSKISSPAGVFSGSADGTYAEAYYKNDISKLLFFAALESTQDFFNGKHFGSETTGGSLKSYLDYLNTIKDGEDLSAIINEQYDVIKTSANNMSVSIEEQIDEDISVLFSVHTDLQQNVIHFKTDMMSALNIRIDYVDADGD